MVYAPIARISNAIARYGIDISRQARWINDANAEQIARINEAAAAIPEPQPVAAGAGAPQPGQPGRQDLGDLGLAHAALSLQEQGTLHGERQVQHGGQVLAGDVVPPREQGRGGVDAVGRSQRWRCFSHRPP